MKSLRKYQFIIFVLLIMASRAQYNESDWDERDRWMDVKQIIEWTGLEDGDAAADIGCHEGYLSMHLARKVGHDGRVFAVDVREDRLQALEKNAADRSIQNITTIHGDYDDPKLPDSTMDVVFLMDTYHEMDAYMTILAHIKKALKPGGRILILEKLKNHKVGKSRQEQASAHTLAPKFVRQELKEAGFIINREFDNLGNWKNEPDKTIWVLIGQVPQV